MQENQWGRLDYLEGLCPVVFCLPGGFLTVMRRAHPLTEEEFAAFDYEKFVERESYWIPVENKMCSFGRLDESGEIVAVDYGIEEKRLCP